MSEMQASTGIYALGHTQKEIQRLLVQGQLLNTFTLRMFENAGITIGMKVLDVGCGPGDVSLLAAEMVGKTGRVLGVDTNASVLQVAQARAQHAGLKHVSFQVADIRNLVLDGQYDAIIGRLILEHLPEHTAILDRLIHHLRPGGVVAFQEYDMVGSTEATLPYSSLWEQACSWVVQVFQQVGVATAEEIGIETLEDRLREEVASQVGVARLPALVSAWTRKA